MRAWQPGGGRAWPPFGLELLLILITAIVIWMPEFRHYWTPTPALEPADIAAARAAPDASTLRELAALSPNEGGCVSQDPLSGADQVQRGELPGFPGMWISVPFREADLDAPNLSAQLAIASLAPVDHLLAGYEASNNRRHLDTAIEYVRAFGAFERGALVPRGLLWNDHAIAARAGVLIRLWADCRGGGCAGDAESQAVLTALLRAAEFLARDDHFNYQTNHGVMQSIALLQIAASLPRLPAAARYRAVAVERLNRQLGYFVSDDGFVLEHSAGYQAFGVELLRRSIALTRRNDVAVPTAWTAKLKAAEGVLEALQRPDGSLPLIGDTVSGPPKCALTDSVHRAADRAPAPRHTLLALGGLSVDWSGMGSADANAQSVLTWSTFAGHGHKHADDLSLTLWRGGTDWLTNVGYWPYGSWGRAHAEDWPGSNAPHRVGEAPDVRRRNHLNAYAWSPELSILDVTSARDDGTSFNRQVVRIGHDLWIAVDIARLSSDRDAMSESWTIFPGIQVEKHGSGWTFRAGPTKEVLNVGFAGMPAVSVEALAGSRDPFGGWVVVEHVPTPATTLRLEQRGSATPWLVSAFVGDSARRPVAPAATIRSTDHWRVALEEDGRGTVVERQASRVVVRSADGRTIEADLQPGPDVQAARTEITRAFEVAAHDWPRFRELYAYRLKISTLFAFAIVVYGALLYVLWRLGRRAYRPVRAAGSLGWLCALAWLGLVYFRV